MDVLRRLAAGELSEVLGPSTLELDREARRLRMRRIAEEHARTLPPADRAVFAAYARGVNYFIETHRNALPLEFTLLRYDPRPWSIVDSLLCGLQMYRSLTTTWREELRKMTMLAGGDPAKVTLLYPDARRDGIPAGLERLGGLRQAHRQRQADSRERSASGLVDPGDVVSGASESARPGRDRRIAARRSLRDYRPQPADRLGCHQSRVRRAGSLHREDRSADRPIRVSRPGGAGALGIGMDSGEGRAAGGVPAVGDAARSGGLRREWPLLRAALGGGGTRGIRVPFSRLESRRQLEGVHGRAGALSGPGAKLRLRRRGRQHRLSGHGHASDPQEFRRRRAGGRQQRATSNGTASFLSINCRPSTIRRADGL